MSISIRRVVDGASLGIISDVDRVCFPVDTPITPRAHAFEAWWLGVDTETGDIACYAGARLWAAAGERALYLHRAGVLPGYRKLGLHKRMISTRVRYAKTLSCAEVWTYTAHDNVASSNNLIANGFRLWIPKRWGGRSNPSRVADGYAWLYWRRALTYPSCSSD